MKSLNEMARSLGLEAGAGADVQIAELCMDSRKQEDHGLFFCISGAGFDLLRMRYHLSDSVSKAPCCMHGGEETPYTY